MATVIPKDALNQHIAVLGKTGSGKTYAAKGIVEGLLLANRQTCIIDPTGAWWGLRLAADGKGKGFDIVLLGGEHADIPLAERSGGAVARLVTEQGASVVLDTSGLTVGEYTRWFIDFAGTLYTTLRNPLHLVIDEAHYFMPQTGGRVDIDTGKMIHAGNRLMSGGRSRGIRGMLITQRPAKLHKDSLTCADSLLAMRVTAPQDRGAYQDWIDGCGDAKQGKAVIESLAELKRGEGWVWYPEGTYLQRVTFPPITTYDSSAAPKHGAKSAPEPAKIDLSEVRTQLADAVKEAEANDPKLLRKRIAELERTSKERQVETKTVEKIVQVEVPVLNNGLLDRTDKLVGTLQAAVDKVAGEVSELRRLIAPAFVAKAALASRPVPTKPIARPVQIPQRKSLGDSLSGEPAEVGRGGLRRILIALAQRPGLNNRQLGLRAGLSSKSGTFSTYLGRARSAGWISDDGDRRSITDDGLAALGEYTPLPEGRELLAYWLNELGSSGAARMLSALAEVYPESLTNQELGERAEVSHASGTFSTYLGRLRGLELIEGGRGAIRLSEELA